MLDPFRPSCTLNLTLNWPKTFHHSSLHRNNLPCIIFEFNEENSERNETKQTEFWPLRCTSFSEDTPDVNRVINWLKRGVESTMRKDNCIKCTLNTLNKLAFCIFIKRISSVKIKWVEACFCCFCCLLTLPSHIQVVAFMYVAFALQWRYQECQNVKQLEMFMHNELGKMFSHLETLFHNSHRDMHAITSDYNDIHGAFKWIRWWVISL